MKNIFTADKDGKLVFTLELDESFSYEGRTFEKLDFALGKLTGYDSQAVEDVLTARGKNTLYLESNSEYMILMAARASLDGIDERTIKALPLSAYIRVRNITRNFLAGVAFVVETEADGSGGNA